MNAKFLLAVAVVVSAPSLLAVSESEVRDVEEAARKLERELSDVRAENRVLETKREALGITTDLMSGRRTEPPRKQVVERVVLRFCEQPVTLDNRTTGKVEVYKKWLDLPAGKRYRVRAMLEIREISGTGNFKFGAMVTRSGTSPDWPAAGIGGQPVAEREVHFDCFCPEGGNVLFLLGFESGKGVATFHDVRVCELTEVLR